MAQEIDLEKSNFQNFRNPVTLTLGCVIWHTTVHHSSTSICTPNVTGSDKMALKIFFWNFYFFTPANTIYPPLQNATLFAALSLKLTEQWSFKVTICRKHKIEKTAVFRKLLVFIRNSLATAINFQHRIMKFGAHVKDSLVHDPYKN